MPNPILASRADMTIDIIGRIEAEEIDQLEEEEKGAGGSGSAGYGRIRFIQL
jgi:CRISPR/Cas system CSM-associated protein Csm3 (group 7 of RAMP superfamily)